MRKAGEFLVRHRNLFLLCLLLVTLVVSSTVQRQRLEEEAIVTSLPVTSTTRAEGAAVAAFVDEREAAYQRDLAALEALCHQDGLDSQTRQNAASQLQEMIRCHEAQQAVADALSASGLAPCTAVLSNGSMTILTENTAFTDADAALALTMAHAHAGVDPANVRIITAGIP